MTEELTKRRILKLRFTVKLNIQRISRDILALTLLYS